MIDVEQEFITYEGRPEMFGFLGLIFVGNRYEARRPDCTMFSTIILLKSTSFG